MQTCCQLGKPVTILALIILFSCLFEFELDKTIVNKESLKNPTKKRKAIVTIKKDFEARYKSGKNKVRNFTSLTNTN
jgi:hypothetical protein